MKRGLWAFGGGVVVSLVTAIVLPNDRVRYGVLTVSYTHLDVYKRQSLSLIGIASSSVFKLFQ